MLLPVPIAARRGVLRQLFTPSLVDVFFCALLCVAFVRPMGIQALLVDGDTGWHIRTGELVLTSGHAPRVDGFSFTRAGQPWFAWEWLADTVFALFFQWCGIAGVAVLAGVVLSLAAAALLARLLGRGCGLWIALAATMAAVSASSIHYLARPHVFYILFYTLALWVVETDRRRPSALLWTLVPLTILWTNLHAGFTAWLATLALLVAVCAFERDWGAARRYGALAAMSAAATLLSPYGWNLHRHIAGYLGASWILDHVQEFQSPSIRSEGAIVFAVLLLGAVALAARAGRFESALVLLWGFAALRSARHIPFFAIAAAPVVADAAARWWRRKASRQPAGATARVLWELAGDLGRSRRASLWLPLGASAAFIVVPLAGPAGFPAFRFPVEAVERNAAHLTPAASMPRVLTSDQWADYLIFRLYPRQRVFFDGRSDFYGPALGADYRKLFAAHASWRELLDRYAFDLALLPYDWPLSTMLANEPGWRRVYHDSVAVLYVRQEGGS